MFWKRFYLLCENNNTSPAEVVRKIGITPAATTKWKNGTTPNGDILIKLSEYFNVSVDYLLGLDDNLTKKQPPKVTVSFAHHNSGWKGKAVIDEHNRSEEFLNKLVSEHLFDDSLVSSRIESLSEICDDLSDEDLQKVFDYANLLKLNQQFKNKEVFLIKDDDIKIEIPYSSIIYLEMQNRKTLIHTLSNVFTVGQSLTKLSKSLPAPFVRCHQSFIVNINFIKNYYENSLELQNGKKLAVGKSFRESQIDALNTAN